MGEAKRKKNMGIEPLPLTKENAVTACMLCLLFMVLLKDQESSDWWVYCQEQSCKYPHGSYRNVFWWSMRTLGGTDEDQRLESFFEYFAWKWKEYEPTGHIRRDGPLL